MRLFGCQTACAISQLIAQPATCLLSWQGRQSESEAEVTARKARHPVCVTQKGVHTSGRATSSSSPSFPFPYSYSSFSLLHYSVLFSRIKSGSIGRKGRQVPQPRIWCTMFSGEEQLSNNGVTVLADAATVGGLNAQASALAPCCSQAAQVGLFASQGSLLSSHQDEPNFDPAGLARLGSSTVLAHLKARCKFTNRLQMQDFLPTCWRLDICRAASSGPSRIPRPKRLPASETQTPTRPSRSSPWFRLGLFQHGQDGVQCRVLIGPLRRPLVVPSLPRPRKPSLSLTELLAALDLHHLVRWMELRHCHVQLHEHYAAKHCDHERWPLDTVHTSTNMARMLTWTLTHQV